MVNRWTKEDLIKLEKSGIKISGMTPIVPPALKAKSGTGFKKKPKALSDMEQLLYLMGVKYETEYTFLSGRRYRFDIALPDHQIGIEYEGLMSDKSRHTTVQGYTGDCTKYNLAQIAGWKVLRYTTINSKEFVNDIKQMLNI
jgi:hypothetical protein